MKTVAIIGAGRVGGAVGSLLARAGYTVTAVAARSRAAAERAQAFIGAGEATTDVVKAAASADIVFIATPDGAIGRVCEAIAAGGGFRQGAVVVHLSGSQTIESLAAAFGCGAGRAVIHPLQSVPTMELGVRNLPGSSFRIEADAGAAGAARELVAALGGVELALPGWTGDRGSAALYHAGAVVVSNYFVALVDFGLQFYRSLGADRDEALKAVLPLIRGTLANIESAGVPGALTGPISRGDVQTVQGHLDAMRQRAPHLLGLYRELGRHTVAVALAKGTLTEQAAGELRTLLKE